MRLHRRPAAWMAAMLVGLAGCGAIGSQLPEPAKLAAHPGTPACQVPEGKGAMGACARTAGAAELPVATVVRRAAPRAATPVYRGEDVSSYQPCRARTYLSFLFFKVAEGDSWTDPTAACEHHANAGIPNGPYFFARPGSPTGQADRFAALAHAIGATRSLPGVLDYEVQAGGCGYIRAFGDRYMHDTGNRRFIVYSAAFIWPGCQLPATFVLWDAAYGPRWNDLAGFAGGATIWQYSDGAVGPTPHLDGNDSDIFLRGTPEQLVAATQAAPAPAPKPRPAPYPGHLLKPGQHGPNVAVLQRALHVRVDGIFGPKTAGAVKAAKRAHHLRWATDAVVGRIAWRAIVG